MINQKLYLWRTPLWGAIIFVLMTCMVLASPLDENILGTTSTDVTPVPSPVVFPHSENDTNFCFLTKNVYLCDSELNFEKAMNYPQNLYVTPNNRVTA